MGERRNIWLIKLFINILKPKRMPNEWRRSTLVPIYYDKRDTRNWKNYPGLIRVQLRWIHVFTKLVCLKNKLQRYIMKTNRQRGIYRIQLVPDDPHSDLFFGLVWSRCILIQLLLDLGPLSLQQRVETDLSPILPKVSLSKEWS